MGTIIIAVADYYDNSKYYPYMPESIFDALEKAFLDGLEVAEVSQSDFNKMLEALKER